MTHHTQTWSMHELCGALHLHTDYSDGNIGLGELIAAAQEVGLDFIGVTDHMTLRGRESGYPGFHGNLFVEVGYEHNDPDDRNHLLAFGVDAVAPRSALPQEYVDFVRARGGAGFLAHPMEKRHYFRQFPPYPWTDWEVSGFAGIEIWNQMSDWIENLKSVRSLVRLFYPRRFMSDAPAALLDKWDALSRARFVAAIGGVDAHTRRYSIGLISFMVFPIKVELKGIRTHVYLEEPLPRDNPQRARLMLVGALAQGRGFVSNFRRGDARGTRLYLRSPDGSIRVPGLHQAPASYPATLHVDVPLPAEIRLIRNGACTNQCNGSRAEFSIEGQGVYRIEARRGGKAWIYSNPFPIGEYPL